ncbi:thioesterase [Planomonospora sp. ID67723]|nr:thioesterase [Planomonospora sp. ID67723]
MGDEARVRLVCFPHAGGAAGYFHGLAAAVPSAVDVLGVQYPGRQDRLAERPVDRVEELAERIAERLLPWRDVPLVLFGHSMGALVASEVARRLDRDPAGLIVSGRPAPSSRPETVLPDRDDELLAHLEELAGTDARLLADPQMRQIILSALRADYRAIDAYEHVPGPPAGYPISVMVGAADPAVTPAEAGGWLGHSSAPRALRVFSGGHFYLDAWPAPIVAAIVADISSFIDFNP